MEKRLTSPLMEPKSVEKIYEIDEHVGCAMSGLAGDARMMVEHARVETQNHRFNYNKPMLVEACAQSICDLALRFGEDDDDDDDAALVCTPYRHRVVFVSVSPREYCFFFSF